MSDAFYGHPGRKSGGRVIFSGLQLVLVLAFCGLVLAGCSTTRPVVPATLLSCQPHPQSPAGGTQRDAALYIVDLAAAGEDCRSKLGSVSRLVSSE